MKNKRKIAYFLLGLVVIAAILFGVSSLTVEEVIEGTTNWEIMQPYDFSEQMIYERGTTKGDVYFTKPGAGVGDYVVGSNLNTILKTTNARAMYDAGYDTSIDCRLASYLNDIKELVLFGGDWFRLEQFENRTVCILTEEGYSSKMIFPHGKDSFTWVLYKRNSIFDTSSVRAIEYDSYEAWTEPFVMSELEGKDRVPVIIALSDNGKTNSLEITKQIIKERQRTVLSTLSKGDLELKYRYDTFFSIAGNITRSGLEKIRKNPLVSTIRFDNKIGAALDSSVPLVNASGLWDMQIDGINLTGNESMTICVLDSGVNYSHPDLGGCYGSGCKVIGGYNYISPGMNPMDDNGHGTHVAGIVAADGIIKGVAPSLQIASVKVLDQYANGTESDMEKGIDWCRINRGQYNISVIVLSLRMYDINGKEKIFITECDGEDDVVDAANTAADGGLLVVASAGNSGNLSGITSPACGSEVVSVGSVNDGFTGTAFWENANCTDSNPDKDTISCGSNRADILDILAPGAIINSTGLTVYTEMIGTSMTAPHVAGVAALLIQYEQLKNNRTLTPSEIKERLVDTGELISDNETNLTFPRVDAYAALFPMEVYDFQRLESSHTSQIFGFRVKNRYTNKSKSVTWKFDLGNGTNITNSESITLPPSKDLFVYFANKYDGDFYTPNASATVGDIGDFEIMDELIIGDIVAYDMDKLFSSDRERIFGFKVLNNQVNPISINWTLTTGEGDINSDESTTLGANKSVFVYSYYNYSGIWAYKVSASSTDGVISDSTKSISVLVG